MIKSKLSLLAVLFMAVGAFTFTGCGDNGGDDADDVTPDMTTQFEETQVLDDDGNVTQTIVTITDRGEGTGTMTLTKDKVWVLNGLVFVNSGQTLTVEAGTVIKGKSGQGENASALVVARGAVCRDAGGREALGAD